MEQVRLGEIVSFKTGKLNSNAAKPNGEYPFFTCSQDVFRTDTYSFDTECVLLGGNNANGIYPLKYYSGKFDAYQRTYIIQSLDNRKLINRYLYYTLCPKLDVLRSISTGAATKFLTLRILNDVEIDLPPLSTQHKIASILSAYDGLIENNNRRIKILEEMAQTIYREWFVNFRFPGHEKVKMVSPSPLGRGGGEGVNNIGKIPEGWEVKKLENVCKVIPGYAFKSKDWQKKGLPVIKIKNINSDNTVNVDEVDCVSENILSSKLEKYLLKNGDFLIAMTGATAGKVGKLRMHKPMLLNQRVAKIDPEDTYRSYIWSIISTEECQKDFYNLADGAAQPNMSGAQIVGLKLILPPLSLCELYNQKVDDIFSMIDNYYFRIDNLRKTRDLLLPKLISGEIDVEVLDIRIPGGNGNA